MGRKRNIRCPAKSMENPPLAASTPSPAVASTLLPLAAPVPSPVAPHMTFPPSPMPCTLLSSEGSYSTKSSCARSKKNKQNPSKKDDTSRTKRKNHVVIQDEIHTPTSENGAPSDAISIMPLGPTEDEANDEDDERTSELREQVSVEVNSHDRVRSVGLRSGPNHVSESLSSSTQLSQLSYERLRKKYEEMRDEMEAKLQAQQRAFDTQEGEMKKLYDEMEVEMKAKLEAHQHVLDTQIRELETQIRESFTAILTSQGRPIPPLLMPLPVASAHSEIPTQHDSPSYMHTP